MQIRSIDTIAAIATPVGEGAIAIVRVSGPEAISIVDRAFRGKKPLLTTPGYRIRHGGIVGADGNVVDEVLASVFRAPYSYTGEDSVEIGCHGGVFITRMVLSAILTAGARQADPGEFTKRAFLNGKMDLSQAEAVSDLIRAGSERALRNSTAQLNGQLGKNLAQIKNELLEICSLLELQLDFSEEDITIASTNVLEGMFIRSIESVELILSSFKSGKILRDGASIAIVGKPNTGKSSLFNRLLLDNRSIVSSTPGTTRDFLEETVVIEGVKLRLIDTAGLRVAKDEIETEGISRTKEVIRSADITLLVLDATDDERSVEEQSIIAGGIDNGSRLLIIENKVDLVVNNRNGVYTRVSALTGEGISSLKAIIYQYAVGNGQDSDMLICSVRQFESLNSCLNAIRNGMNSLKSGVTYEFIATDIRLAIDFLSEITGEITTEDILNGIFSKFCIGK